MLYSHIKHKKAERMKQMGKKYKMVTKKIIIQNMNLKAKTIILRKTWILQIRNRNSTEI
jgi:hypothetical protein